MSDVDVQTFLTFVVFYVIIYFANVLYFKNVVKVPWGYLKFHEELLKKKRLMGIAVLPPCSPLIIRRFQAN